MVGTVEMHSYIESSIASVGIFCVTLVLIYALTRRRPGIPPGPPCWPLIGNLPSLLGGNTLKTFVKLRQKYGDLFCFYIGSELHIVINGYENIHGTLLKKGSLFARRPTNKYTERRQKKAALVLANDKIWKEHRTLVLHTFRDLCFRKTGFNLEHCVNLELQYFVDHLLKMTGECDLFDIITLSFGNVIYSLLHGQRVGYTDEKFVWFENLLDAEFQRFVKEQVLYHCFPFLIYLPGDLLRERQFQEEEQCLIGYFKDNCAVNYKNYEEGHEKCFVDFWITAGKTNNMFREDNLWIVLHELMAAGSETTATTLKWIILALAKYPHIQRKLQEQVDSVLPGGQTASMTDRESLTYVEATVLEGLRFGSPVPLSVPHAVTQDLVYNGFLIPRNSTVLPNIASVHYDPTIFPEPEKFRPERFLNETETKIIGTDKLIPFSLGPRSCAGETIARTELFLYVTTLVQHLEIKPPLHEMLPDMEGVFGLTHRPKRFKVKIVKRQN